MMTKLKNLWVFVPVLASILFIVMLLVIFVGVIIFNRVEATFMDTV